MADVKVLIVDDHKIVRVGIATMLEEEPGFNVIGFAENGREAVELAKHHSPDVLVMDVNMPEMDGIEAARIIKEELPSTKILALSMMDDQHHIKEMMKSGASGYIMKDSEKEELITAIEEILKGKHYFSHDATQSVLMGVINSNGASTVKEPVELTEREIEVVQMIADELTNKEIADKLYLSVRTIDAHRRNILQKVGAKNTAGLVRYALTHGIIKDN